MTGKHLMVSCGYLGQEHNGMSFLAGDELRSRGITPYIPKRRKKGQKDEPKYNQKIKPFYKTYTGPNNLHTMLR